MSLSRQPRIITPIIPPLPLPKSLFLALAIIHHKAMAVVAIAHHDIEGCVHPVETDIGQLGAGAAVVGG